MAAPMNTPRMSDFIFPYSPFVARVVISFANAIAKTVTGSAKKPAKDVSGMTAPSSPGPTYFGTSHRPTKALSTSAARHAQKSIREYHQKSPSLAWSLESIYIVYQSVVAFDRL